MPIMNTCIKLQQCHILEDFLVQVRFLFLVSVTLCKRTSSLPHPPPKSQIGSVTPVIRLHYPDGQYSVPPEVVEASLGQHIQVSLIVSVEKVMQTSV